MDDYVEIDERDSQNTEAESTAIVSRKPRGKYHTKTKLPTKPNAGDNTRYLLHTMEINNLSDGKPLDMRIVEDVRERWINYFKICAQNDMKPSMAGLSLAYGVTRHKMTNWINGVAKDIPRECAEELQKAYIIINSQMEDYMQNGKINPVSGIFLMKNNLNYEEKREILLTPNNLFGDETPPEDLKKKYLESVD